MSCPANISAMLHAEPRACWARNYEHALLLQVHTLYTNCSARLDMVRCPEDESAIRR